MNNVKEEDNTIVLCDNIEIKNTDTKDNFLNNEIKTDNWIKKN